MMHQKPKKLKKRGLLAPNWKGKLTRATRGTLPARGQDTPQYKEELKKAQTEVGSLQWLAQKSRPDIACLVAIAA
eukprot:12900257-Prorocentrum_lima.AAC.1